MVYKIVLILLYIVYFVPCREWEKVINDKPAAVRYCRRLIYSAVIVIIVTWNQLRPSIRP